MAMWDIIYENALLKLVMLFVVGFLLSVIAVWFKNQSEPKGKLEDSERDQD